MDDARMAAYNYGCSITFVFDCLGSFPLNLVLMAAESSVESGEDAGRGPGNINRVLRLIRMTKLLKLTRMIKLVKYMSNFEECASPGPEHSPQVSPPAMCSAFACARATGLRGCARWRVVSVSSIPRYCRWSSL